jgi:hypothetical protein
MLAEGHCLLHPSDCLTNRRHLTKSEPAKVMLAKQESLVNANSFNRCFIYFARIVIKYVREVSAFLTRKAFYCNALTGDSAYNICVNSDMTVSCNCKDFEGLGQIGDLRCQSLEQIFASAKANAFRQSLAAGKLPLVNCAECSELNQVPSRHALWYVHNFKAPNRGLMVENTVTCCYNCLSCNRQLLSKIRKRKSMDLDDIRRVSTELATNEVKHLCFFNLGEPFCAEDIYEQLNIIRSANSNIRITISTNGLLLDTDQKRRAALLADHIFVSLDGMDDCSVNRYQLGASFSRVYDNMKNLIRFRNNAQAERPTIEWKYVLFNWNDRPEQVQRAIELARVAGVDCISFWPARTPLNGISWRYHFHPFYRTLGRKTSKGREIDLANKRHNSNAVNRMRKLDL